MRKLWNLEEVKAEFEKVMNLEGMQKFRRNVYLVWLMDELEGLYSIPAYGSCENVPEDVMRLYREISQEREI